MTSIDVPREHTRNTTAVVGSCRASAIHANLSSDGASPPSAQTPAGAAPGVRAVLIYLTRCTSLVVPDLGRGHPLVHIMISDAVKA